MWHSILCDKQLNVVDIASFNPKLYFGVQLICGTSLAEMIVDNQNLFQAERVAQAIECAFDEKRTVCLNYLSYLDDGIVITVSSYVEYLNDESVSFNAMQVNDADLSRMRITPHSDVMNAIMSELPVSVEIYDSNAKLIDVSQACLEQFGVKDKASVLGLSLFDNPNFSNEVKVSLLAGESQHFRIKYDMDKANREYFRTYSAAIRELDVMICVLKDEQGNITKYVSETKDLTDYSILKQRYDALYNQNRIVVDAMPVGMVLYSGDGNMIHVNDMLCQMFGIDKEQFNGKTMSIFDDPSLPPEIKIAVRDSKSLDICFKYDIRKVVAENFYETTQNETIHLKCCGRPAFNSEGKIENYVFIIEDITESVHTEEILRSNRQKTNLAMSAADIRIWEYDVCTDRFYTEGEPLSEFIRDQTLNINTFMECIHADDYSTAADVMEKAKMGEDITINLDLRMYFPGEPELQYCTILGVPFQKDENGRVIKYVGARKNNTVLQKKHLLQNNILNNMPLPILIKDMETGKYVFCNEESRNQLNIRDGVTVHDIFTPKSAAEIELVDNEVFSTGNPYSSEERIELKDGRILDMIVRKSLIYDSGKTFLLTVRWDQSLQNDLKRRAKALAMSMDALNAYFWYYDTVSNTINYGDGIDRLGIDPMEINTIEKFSHRVHPDERQTFIDNISTALSHDNYDYTVEFRMDLDGNGTYEWWENRGAVETIERNGVSYKYMFGMDVNIDSHKQTEMTLVQNREELNNLILKNELVLNNANSGLAYITPDYVVQWENTANNLTCTGMPYKRGEHCYKRTFSQTEPCVNCVMKKAVASRQMERTKYTLDNGHMVEIFATPVLEANGDVNGVVVRVDDVTDRESMINELKQAKAHAEQSDKLKSAFLANMSHEIRTPLNAILGFSELIMYTDDDDERQEYIKVINTNNDLLLKLINDIIDLSKIESGSVELRYDEFDMSDYFDGMVVLIKHRLTNPNITIESVNPYKTCLVHLDYDRVTQILDNYVANAIKYTSRGSIKMSYECVDGGIYFSVQDGGIGIAEDKKGKVFDRFEKVDEFAQGTGLGLSICKAIAESMGGKVGFESTLGVGSNFWAFLPCQAEYTK